MLTTPSGKPASRINSPRRRMESGVCSAGFRTTVQPEANAGPSFHAAINSGKFHGIICPTTPTGSRRVYARYFAPGVYGTEIGIVVPSILVDQPAIYRNKSTANGTSAARAT